MRGTDTAYDPARDLYLAVTGNGAIYAAFVNAAGVPITGAFPVMDGSLGWGHFPRVEYSPDIWAGQGGFLVTWHHNVGNVNCVFGRIVSRCSAWRIGISRSIQISDGAEGGSWWETGPAMAYSRTSHRFLVAWRTIAYGVSGRLIDSNGTLLSGVVQLAPPAAGTGSRDPALAWNPATDEFGLITTGWSSAGALASFRRIRAADGYVWGRSDFGFSRGTFSTAIDVNTSSNNYVVAWGLHPGTMTATLDPWGNVVTSNLATGRLGFDQSLGMSFNPGAGTLLAVSSDLNSLEIGAVEVNGIGVPNGAATLITDGARQGSFYPMVAARGPVNQWQVIYSRDFRGATSQMIATTSTGGGGVAPPPPPPPPPPPGFRLHDP